MKIPGYLALCLLLIPPLSARAWYPLGHETVAVIAEKNISRATARKLKPLLADGETLESISIWADVYRMFHPETAPWHFISLPIRKDITVADLPRYYTINKHGPEDNVIAQINRDVRILGDTLSSLNDRREALKYLVHFVGDLHMPLHAADDNDGAGAAKMVRIFNRDSPGDTGRVYDLHFLWNNLLDPDGPDDPRGLAGTLNRRISDSLKQEWEKGSVEDWALESHNVAKNVIYARTFSKGITDLPADYYAAMRPYADQQLERAGIRLAFLLEKIFGK